MGTVFLNELFDRPFEKKAPFIEYTPIARAKVKEAGIPTYVRAIFESPFEVFAEAYTFSIFNG